MIPEWMWVTTVIIKVMDAYLINRMINQNERTFNHNNKDLSVYINYYIYLYFILCVLGGPAYGWTVMEFWTSLRPPTVPALHVLSPDSRVRYVCFEESPDEERVGGLS